MTACAPRIPVLAAALVAGLALPVSAQTDIPLEVVGPGGDRSTMTRDEIEALPQTEYQTSTIWTDGIVSFSGVPVATLLQHANVDGATLTMTALNDYSIEMPVSDLMAEYPLLATRMDGQPMSVRDKGPYWVIYPYDESPHHQTETTHARSVWQLVRLTVTE